MAPPIKTTAEDFDVLFAYLRTQVGWVPIDKVRKTIESKYADNRKIEAGRYLGLVDRDGANIRLSQTGQEFAAGDEGVKARVMREALKQVPLYSQTFEWIHHGNRAEPTRTEVGNYWHDKLSEHLDGAQGAALTDAVIFFFRVSDVAGLGKFIPAGNRRPTALLRCDLSAVGDFVSAKTPATALPPSDEKGLEKPAGSRAADAPPAPQEMPPSAPPMVTTSPAVNINVEIHIAADSSPETIEEIFKNMRKYVLSDGS